MSATPPFSEHLGVSVHDEGGVRIVRVVGAASAEQVERFEGELRALPAAGARLLLDLSELTFINSAGLGVIVAVHRECREGGGALCLVAPREAIARVLRITRLDQLIPVYPDLDAARQALRAAVR